MTPGPRGDPWVSGQPLGLRVTPFPSARTEQSCLCRPAAPADGCASAAPRKPAEADGSSLAPLIWETGALAASPPGLSSRLRDMRVLLCFTSWLSDGPSSGPPRPSPSRWPCLWPCPPPRYFRFPFKTWPHLLPGESQISSCPCSEVQRPPVTHQSREEPHYTATQLFTEQPHQGPRLHVKHSHPHGFKHNDYLNPPVSVHRPLRLPD